MRVFPASLVALALFTTAALAQVANWWGGQPTATGYPNQSTPITASGTGTTAPVAVTLPGASGKTTFLCGFSFTSMGSGSTTEGTGTVTGIIGGTMSFVYVNPSSAQGLLIHNFAPCLPASAMNTPIVVTQAAGGTGGVTATNAWGVQL